MIHVIFKSCWINLYKIKLILYILEIKNKIIYIWAIYSESYDQSLNYNMIGKLRGTVKHDDGNENHKYSVWELYH